MMRGKASLRWVSRAVVWAAACLSAVLLMASSARSQNGSGPTKPKAMSIPEVVALVKPSVATIMTRGVPPNPFQHPSPPGSGSGLIIDDKGYILTNNHLVEGTRNVVVGLPSGKLMPGRVVGRDFLLDLALVKIEAKDLVAARLGHSSTLQIGETVVAIGTIGNPFATKGGSIVTIGVVSALDQAILPPNGETLYDLIQTDAAINPGNSGGPLVDLSGRVVGITVAVAPSAQAISYAISIDAAYPNIQSMLVRGAVLRPDLGFVPVTVTPSVAASFNLYVDRGVLAAQVEPLKPAAQSGLQDGDVITAIDQTQIYNMGDFWHTFLQAGEQFPAQLTVYGKNGQFSELSLPRVPPPQASR
ncbi:MAG: trypsin-like peptidase domain-containing protein [Nitrospirae bacterium]|nr:trypsin-like peptidase domain-containing protein [Nitrospirota bacterium]